MTKNEINPLKKTATSVAMSLTLLTSAHAVTIASDDFSSGLASGGSGWDSNWVSGSNGGSAGAATFGDTSAPLGGNAEYTSITGSGANPTEGIHREYSTALPVIGQEHTISFLFRLDTLAAATGDPSRGLVSHGATSFGLGGNSTWAFYVQEGTFRYFDGDGAGSFGGAQTNSGVTVAVGDLYSVSITNRVGANTVGSPLTGGEWDLLVTNLDTSTTALDLTDLEYRTLTAPTDLVIGLGVAGNNATSFDQISVDAIPEPSSAMLLGLGAFGLLLRRKK